MSKDAIQSQNATVEASVPGDICMVRHRTLPS